MKPTTRIGTGCRLAGLLPVLACAPAAAESFSFLEDELRGSLDTTLSYGQLWRTQAMDKGSDDVNINDGNRNFKPGLVSEVFKMTSDLELTWQNYGAFVRGSAFYDTRIMDKRNAYYDHGLPSQPSQNSPRDDSFTRATRHSAGRKAEILDAYVYGDWTLGSRPFGARFGRQVFNWGEGMFYRGGVNSTNPINASKFRLPGAELKEVLMPLEALSFNLGLSDNLSMEAFYQFKWEETRLDPVGTFFSETDLFAQGGNSAYANLPQLAGLNGLYRGLSQLGVGGLRGGPLVDGNGNLKVASIGRDLKARDDGQFGLALRYVAERLNNTEFGFYFVNYHSKEPTIHADLQGYKGVDMAQLKAGATPAIQQAVAAQAGISVAQLQGLLAAAPGSPLAQAYNQALNTAVGGLATLDVAGQVRGQRDYAEDIRMFGLSFNTPLGLASVFGELTYRPNMPIGIGTTADLLGDLLSQAPELAAGRPVNIGGQMVDSLGQVKSSERVEMFNTSLGALYNFGPRLGFDSVMGVFEVASEHLRASSLSYTAWDGTRRRYSGRTNGPYLAGFGDSAQVTRDAYGYTAVLTGTWNDVFAGVNLSPFVIYKDDVSGNSHQSGNFIEGRKALSLGMKAHYQHRLEAEMQYTAFYGGGRNNLIADRDNLGFNLKYAF